MPQRRRQRLLTAATLLAAAPAAARATTYDLSFQSVNVATAPYTAADTLHLNATGFSSSLTNATLLPSLDLFSSTYGNTVTTTGNITFAGSLAGTGSLQKTGTGSLTLTAPSPSFTGPFDISSTGTLKLTDPLALGPASASPINFIGTLDVSAALPARPLRFSFANFLNNSPNPVTLGPAGSILPDSSPSINFGGTGDITFAASYPAALFITKSGTITLTYSTNTTLQSTFSVNAGTLALGINAPFSGPGSISINSGATLDLNGFSSPGVPLTVNSSGTIVNNNPASTPNLATFPGGFPTFGGSANLNLTAKAGSFTKTGSATLSLSAASTSFAGTLTLNDGTVQLNHTSALGNSSAAAFKLNATSSTYGTLDLNGYPAPAGTYTFNGGTLANNNTSAPSALDLSTAHLAAASQHAVFFAGDGDLSVTGTLGSNFYKDGAGALIVNTPQSITAATLTNGSLRLNFSSGSYTGYLTLYGYNTGTYFDHYGPGALLDLYGSPSSPAITAYNNVGIVNNNPAVTSTFTGSLTLASNANARNLTFGGDGNLVLPNTLGLTNLVTINKVGAGTLILPTFQGMRGVNLRAGTLQAESPGQLGSNVSFLGGTLRIAPFALAPKPSYTFSATISVDPATGGTLETTYPTTFTGLLTGAGPLTKTGTASLTLNPSPSSRLALTVAAGTLLLRPTTGTPHLTSLSLAPNTSLDTPALLLDYTDLPTTAAELRQYLAAHQLTSSLSPLPLGYAPQPDGTLLIQPTPYGDANLDGQITPDDYALLDRGYAQHATTWYQGDFNYDGTINTQDYLLIDQSLFIQAQGLQTLGPLLAQRESQFGPQYVSTLLASLPEPTPALTCLLAAIPLRRRRFS